MAKKLIRLTENDLHRIVKESVKRILEAEGNGEESLPLQIIHNPNISDLFYDFNSDVLQERRTSDECGQIVYNEILKQFPGIRIKLLGTTSPFGIKVNLEGKKLFIGMKLMSYMGFRLCVRTLE
jgi:hypothetical protein